MGKELGLIYQDQWLAAVDKPQGILVHGDGSGARTLTDDLRELLEAQGTDASGLQPVQRLDVDTSGLVLFSLDKGVQPKLDALVASHGIEKRYVALVEGRFPAGTRDIELPLGRDRHDARRMRASRGGKPSHTRVRLLGTDGHRSLVAVELLTGRRHQIRVHLSQLGFPLVGDVLYGSRSGRATPRSARSRNAGPEPSLMLHALEEEFDHPVTGEHLLLSTPWPGRFSVAFPGGEELWRATRAGA